MRAAWYERNGPAREVLQVGEMPDPRPAAGEVRVRIAYSGVNPSDVKRRAGSHPLVFARAIPGMDGSGIIDRVGAKVDRTWIGRRVWLHSTAYGRPFGTCAQYAVTPLDRIAVLPDGISHACGATLGVPAMTAHRAVFVAGPVRDRTVLVTGGAGAVGFYAVQLAKRAGAKVIATVSSGEKARLAELAGADRVLDYRHQDIAAEVLAATGGVGVNHVVDVDLAANLETNLAVLAPNGSIAAYASASNPNPTIPFARLMFRNIGLHGLLVYEMGRAAIEAATSEITAWLGESFTPPPLHVFGLERMVEAHLAVEAGAIGKVLIEIAGELQGR